MDKRIAGLPVAFVVVVTMTIILTIFFGAWAVSADVEDRDRSLAFGIAAGGSSFGGLEGVGSRENATGNSINEDGEEIEDAWWGQALLKACPFH